MAQEEAPQPPSEARALELLKDSVAEYHDPTEPVAEQDWEALG